ncbi:hypothetical protein [Pseudomonas jessenii]|uniref:DUF1566 domain-containing protein n=1 Tax=Pseudomonas jessenii TaxID=77298 RepID=A0A370SWQ1_PSEJE|nr:hypothetical protein [Pseudomonas jessenii]RDL24132.1 hypothetical protein DEU51_102390 [Pseudomonas jessenii]
MDKAISPTALPTIGQPFAGGFYAGRVYFDGAEHAVIDSGRSFEVDACWWERGGPRPRIRGATSRYDGFANTKAMAAEGSAIAIKVLGANIRGTWGWHIPSIEELQVLRANLLQIEGWGHGPGGRDNHAPERFCLHEYWSSSQKENSATAWCLHMLPWCVPDSNWVSACKGIRPVKVMQIKSGAFVHAPSTDAPPTEADLRGLANQAAVASVIERFVNEDAGKFYGRTDALVAELAAIAGGRT